MDINKLKLTPDSSIKEALKIVGQERVRLGIIVDKKDKFLESLVIQTSEKL